MRKIVSAFFFVGAVIVLIASNQSYQTYRNARGYAPKHSYAVQTAKMVGFSGVLFAVSVVLFLTAKKKPPRRLDNRTRPDAPSKDPTIGREFDENSLGRQRTDFYASQPGILRGRVRDLRGWIDERTFSASKVVAFHLDYNRQTADFGDVLVKFDGGIFRRFQFKEGDDIELALEWEGKNEPVALIGEVRNISSGQHFEPPKVGEKIRHGRAARTDGGRARLMIVQREHIDYLQRAGEPEPLKPADLEAGATAALRRLSWVRTIGVDRHADDLADRGQTTLPDLAMSLYAARISLAYVLVGRGDSVSVYLGNWDKGAFSPVLAKAVDDRQAIIGAGLRSLYPATDTQALEAKSIDELTWELGGFTQTGYVLGLPTVTASPGDRRASPMDRIIRGLSGTHWACMLLAEPVSSTWVHHERETLIEEMREIPQAAGDGKTPNVLGSYYRELLMARLQTLTSSLGSGCWRTAAYLMGNESYQRLTSLWQGVFTGEEGLLEPVRVWRDNVRPLIQNWAMSKAQSARGHSRINRLLEHQTILSSGQLAAYLHLPRVEVNGFRIKHVATFGVTPQSLKNNADAVTVGKILTRDQQARERFAIAEYERLPNAAYRLPKQALKKHIFVAGVTGSGKTTTVFQLLKQAYQAGIPFLVIEPAKTEYRELLDHAEVGGALQVYTLGNETVSPLRINPFEVGRSASVAQHIDLLRSLFSASFGLWTPLPQILETCLVGIYENRGWDLTNNKNHRLDDAYPALRSESFPTMSDLLLKIEEITLTLEWDPEAKSRIRGSLLDRLRSLVNGARGSMLDTQYSISSEELFLRPTVLELEALGDDDDKAFMMGLLLIRLAEFRRYSDRPQAAGGRDLEHLLVFEEAHRLLTNVKAGGDQAMANPKAKAVETFTNLLSEIRSYGQGVIVADQVPVKLAPDVIKNTNVKIAHRIVDAEDRHLMAGAMAMNEDQTDTLSRLLPGVAAVYAEGDDMPSLVWSDPGKAANPKPKPDDPAIKAHMRKAARLAAHPGCTDPEGTACRLAGRVVAGTAFRQRLHMLVLSVLEDPSAAARLWPSLASLLSEAMPANARLDTVNACAVAHAARDFVRRNGAARQWPYEDMDRLATLLKTMLGRAASGEKADAAALDFAEAFKTLCERRINPYPHCSEICDQPIPLCLYRDAAADIVATGRFNQEWNGSGIKDDGRGAQPPAAHKSWWVCQHAAEQMLEWNPLQGMQLRRAGLCFGQIMLAKENATLTAEAQKACFDRLNVASAMKLGI